MRIIDGGVLVADLQEGEQERDGALRIWNHFSGDALSLRVLELDGTATLHNDSSEEVLYVIAGGGTANGREVKVDDGIYVPPRMPIEIAGTMTLVSSRVGESASGQVGEHLGSTELAHSPTRPLAAFRIVSLLDCPIQQTADRWYREVIEGEVTQFVGSIPPGRAPDHFHLYEEVLCILDGEGEMWAGASHTPIATGSCIFLPRRQVHCVENRGTRPLRLLGVFYPAGSPAVRYPA